MRRVNSAAMLLLSRASGWLAILLLIVSVAGCAQQTVSTPHPAAATTGPATWTLDQIGPAPRLPAAATRPADDLPSLDAIALFARARAASQDDDRATAIALLKQALSLDPDSYELHSELGSLYREGFGFQPAALAEFEKAAEIEPDRIDAQLDVARQLLANGDNTAAFHRLRLAIQTSQYAAGHVRSAEADFLLAHSMRELGYDRAALDRFELLLDRLSRGDIERSDEVARILNTRLFMQIGDLYIKRDRPADALRAYRTAEGTLDGSRDIDVKSRVVRAMMLDGQVNEGMARAADVVRQFGASPAALSLLRDVYSAVGRPEGVTSALADLHRQFPDDRQLLFALCEVLAADRRFDAADEQLTVAWQRTPGSPALLVRWFRLRFDRDPESAVRLLADLLTESSSVAGQIDPVWRRMTSVEGREAFPLERLLAMRPPAGAKAAHAFIIHRVARDWPRASLSRRSLDASLAARPPFAPAFADKLEEVLTDPRLPPHARLTAADALASAAELAGDPGLADLLRGRIALVRGDGADAQACFQAAIQRNPNVPEARLGLAAAGVLAGEVSAAVQQAWAVARAFPEYEPAFVFLDAHPDRADPPRVFADWKLSQPAGEPVSPELSLRQAEDQIERGNTEGAELLLADLDRQSPADARLLDLHGRIEFVTANASASAVPMEVSAQPRQKARLEKLIDQGKNLGPAGLTEVAARLSAIYAREGRPADAARPLAAARPLVGGEPDLLYRLAVQARACGDDRAAETWLQSALEIDPENAAVMEELSSLWASTGKHLEAAEKLARQAAERFPQAPGLRGNVGWVLYRAGRLTEARDELLAAIRQSEGPAGAAGAKSNLPATNPAGVNPPGIAEGPVVDPVLLDRTGDVLYRLGDRPSAAALWERAQRRLGDADVATADRADIRALRQSLPRKLKQHRTGQEVQVSTSASR
ncbi:tetratricopeptide repeat protein [Humisphaera borealis]|uniref:Tetratricopeptide repeat protein n=1 Tax=Humisphaera borealis TaxID=2807512 RepID=A0A7M2WWQ1_9BACT|nr:tetratricopeptide repeat protein [Humisphaera borealis]QOV88940.1 tetratricopeptide repeat protein [Humisphaera borealis]